MSAKLMRYLSEALGRADAGHISSPSGSWLAGIFGRSASMFEQEFRAYVGEQLRASNMKYRKDFSVRLKGAPSFEKLTLGKLIAVAREIGEQKPQGFTQLTEAGWTLSCFLDEVELINKTWIKTKHGGEFSDETLLNAMRVMLKLAKTLNKEVLQETFTQPSIQKF